MLEEVQGCEGRITPGTDGTHTQADDLTYVIETSYTDEGGLTDRQSATLQPRRKEAEHHDGTSGTRNVLNSSGPSLGLVGGISTNDWVKVEPVNLAGVPTMSFRVASAANGGTLEIRQDAPDGPLLGSVAVPVTGGGQNWTEVTAAVTDPGGAHALFLVAKNPGVTGDLFNLDWVEFGAPVSIANLSLPAPINAGDRAHATVDLINQSNRTVRATVGLTVPAGWTMRTVDVVVEPGRTTAVRIPFTSPEPGAVTGPLIEGRLTAYANTRQGARISGTPAATTYLMPSTQRTVFALDAGSPTSPLQSRYQRLDPTVRYSEETGFGWVNTTGLEFRDRGAPDGLRGDMVTSQGPATLRLRIPAGSHTVSLLRGDAQFAAQPVVVTVDGQRVVNGGVQLATNRWGWDQFTVDGGASGRTVDVTFSIDIAQYWRVNAIMVEKVAT